MEGNEMAKHSTLHRLLLDVRDGKLAVGEIGSTFTWGDLRHTERSLTKSERSVLGRACWSMGLVAVDTELGHETPTPSRPYAGSGAPRPLVTSQPHLTEAGAARLERFEKSAGA